MTVRTSAQVNYVRAEVGDLLSRWNLVKDCIAGSEEIKKKGITYLPKPNASDESDANTTRYAQYKERAVFYGVTGRTLRGLVGQVFNRDVVTDLPPLVEQITDDIDGASVELDQQAKKALGQVLSYGRCGLLVDYPNVDAAATVAELQSGAIRPVIIRCDPWDVINWRFGTFGSKKLLTLVVISESQVANDDGFEEETVPTWRVLRLIGGIYETTIYQEAIDSTGKTTGQFVIKEGPFYPKDASGQHLTEIPFTFIGSENNDFVPDLPPLYDLAGLNIAHYRNSADYEESCYMVGQPTPYFTGLTEAWVTDVLKGQIQLGSRAAVPLPVGGSAGLLQAAPNTIPMEAMLHKEKQMVALGAKLAETKQVQRTATEASIDEASETSVLSTAAQNVSEAYEQALTWCAMFLGAPTDTIEYALNTDFETNRMAAQERQQLLSEWQGGGITFDEYRWNLTKAGITNTDTEAARETVDNEFAPSTPPDPTGANQDGGQDNQDNQQ